jgi:hypothetical protein
VVPASEPPELSESEIQDHRPAWVEPPADVVSGIVPVELILARTPQRAIGLTGLRAYPTGFGCTLHLRLRQVIPGEQSTASRVMGAVDRVSANQPSRKRTRSSSRP